MLVGLLAKTLVPFPSGEKCVGTLTSVHAPGRRIYRPNQHYRVSSAGNSYSRDHEYDSEIRVVHGTTRRSQSSRY